jgi:hypothetical protein
LSDIEDHALSWQYLVEALPDLLDERGVMRYVTELLTVLTSFRPDELIDQNVQMVVPPRHRNAQSRARTARARSENSPDLERP